MIHVKGNPDISEKKSGTENTLDLCLPCMCRFSHLQESNHITMTPTRLSKWSAIISWHETYKKRKKKECGYALWFRKFHDRYILSDIFNKVRDCRCVTCLVFCNAVTFHGNNWDSNHKERWIMCIISDHQAHLCTSKEISYLQRFHGLTSVDPKVTCDLYQKRKGCINIYCTLAYRI